MWSAPIPRRTPDGKLYHLLLLDTEGIDAYDQTGQYSIQIFSLAVLLSSMFIYNQMGGIDEAALDRLSLVTEMTKHIHVRAQSSDESAGQELGRFSPYFLWLLRDFYLDLSEEGHQITARDYLETALRPVAATNDAAIAKNNIRSSIANLFPNRDSFTLVRPMNDEKQLQRMAELRPEEFRPEFRSGVTELLRRIFANAAPKTVGGACMTGPMLAGLAEMYVTAINNGAVPTIATAWQGVAEAECRRGMEAGELAYQAAWEQMEVVPEEGPLADAHAAALAAAVEAFELMAVGDAEIQRGYLERLKESMGKRHAHEKQAAFAEANSACVEAIGDAASRLRLAAVQPDATVEEMSQRVAAEVAEFETSLRGPQRWRKVTSFLAETAMALVVEVASRTVRDAEARAAEADAKASAAQAIAEQARADAAEARAAAEAAKAEAREAREAAGEATREAARAQMSEREALQHKADALHRAADAEARTQLVEARLDELERAATELHRSHSSTESLLKQSEATVASLNAQVQDQKSEMQTLHAELEACADKRRAEAERATQAEVSAARAEATVRAMEAEIAREKALASAAAQREGALRRRLESGKQRGATFDTCLAQFQVEAQAAATSGLHHRNAPNAYHMNNMKTNFRSHSRHPQSSIYPPTKPQQTSQLGQDSPQPIQESRSPSSDGNDHCAPEENTFPQDDGGLEKSAPSNEKNPKLAAQLSTLMVPRQPLAPNRGGAN